MLYNIYYTNVKKYRRFFFVLYFSFIIMYYYVFKVVLNVNCKCNCEINKFFFRIPNLPEFVIFICK